MVASRASVYEVVVLDGVPGLIRSGVVKQLVAAVPKARHDRFLVVSESVEKLKRFLGVTDGHSAYLALVAPNGDVTWRGRGAVTEAAYVQLSAALRSEH